MAEAVRIVRIPTLKTAAAFRERVTELGLEIPCDEGVLSGGESPLSAAVAHLAINGKRLANRYAVQPMEGWDATTAGGITDEVRRRWRRFGQSGAKLICGGEAMAVRADGRANPHQLIISEQTKADLAELRNIALQAHQERYGTSTDLVIGFQLTHSGRFCKPTDHARLEPRVAYRHPLLDRRFGVSSDTQVFTDSEIRQLIEAYILAAKIAWVVGADFVDIKHCHGYLLHEFLSAYTRSGQFGGSFENRTRILREIVHGIRADGNPIEIGVRLSAFDFVPFRPDPSTSTQGKMGIGVPEEFSQYLPYRYAFGVKQSCPLEVDLTETFQFARLCQDLGVKILNLSAGSPYYNPHLQRPAVYPPSDGYQPPEDPLLGVARQIQAARRVRQFLCEHNPAGRGAGASLPPPSAKPDAVAQPGECPILIVGSAYSYLQEFLPQVAQAVVRNRWTDLVGIGRMVLSYPGILADALERGRLDSKQICRTFSDCTTAPRQGLISGCYPLDPYYSAKPQAKELKLRKKAGAE